MLKWLDKRENDRTQRAEYHIILKTILEGKRGFQKERWAREMAH